MQSIHALLKLAQLRWTWPYLPECLMNVCQRKSSMEIYKSENASMVVRKIDTRTHMIEQSGEVSSEGVLVNTKQKESLKPSRNVHSGKPKLRHRQQSFLPQTSLVLFSKGSLELRLVSLAILEYINNNSSRISRLVIVRNDRQTKHLSHNVRKRTFWHMRPTKTQIRLSIRAVWSESSLSPWRHFVPLAIKNVLSKDSDQSPVVQS